MVSYTMAQGWCEDQLRCCEQLVEGKPIGPHDYRQ